MDLIIKYFEFKLSEGMVVSIDVVCFKGKLVFFVVLFVKVLGYINLVDVLKKYCKLLIKFNYSEL